MTRDDPGIDPPRTLRQRRLGLALLCLALLAIRIDPAYAETRIALVVGNAAYETKRLKNARNDAELMARTLTEAGFDVIPVFDGDSRQMRGALEEFGRKLATPDAVALFYYSGHGVQARGENYLIPLAAGISSMSEVTANALALGDVFAILTKSHTRLNIVILDACRDNPFAAAGAPEAGLAPVVAPAGTLIGYATAPGQTARDGSGNNSPYTAALSAQIPKDGLTVEEVFRGARRRVIEVTASKQVPWEHSSLIGEFYFKPKAVAPETSERRQGAAPDGDGRLAELDAWDLIKTSKDPALFKAHIERFPGGVFSELAAIRITKLETVQILPAWTPLVTTGSVETTVNPERTFERAVQLDGEPSSPEDLKTAAALYREAAEQGLPQAMFALGRAYDKGRGLTRDLKEAARWYERAAEKDHAGAMASLGTMYEFGEGTGVDLTAALRLYRKSAEAGDANGLTNLAYLFAQGKGVAKTPAEARRLYAAAAEKGTLRAMFNLALMLLRAEGGPVDIVDALRLLHNAAERGHAGASQELAYLYDEGRGVARNPKLAASHYIGALKSAHRDGRKVDLSARGWTFATRRELQRQLAAKGLYKGGIHGFFNEATRKALVAASRG